MKDVVRMLNEEEAPETASRYEAAHFRKVATEKGQPSSWFHHLHGAILLLFGLYKGLFYLCGHI